MDTSIDDATDAATLASASILSDSFMVPQSPALMKLSATAPSNRMKVYLRVRPVTPNEQLSCTACAGLDLSSPTGRCFTADSANGWLVARSPSTLQSQQANTGLDESKLSNSASANGGGGGGGERVSNRFTFSGVFDETADQQGLYAGTVAETVRQLAEGDLSSGLLFNYGVTSSGKTFTVQGTPQSPGLLPRALADLFRRLDGQLSGAEQLLPFRPVSFSEAAPLAPDEARAALAETRAVLSRFDACDAQLGDWRAALQLPSPSPQLPADAADPVAAGKVGSRCSVWVSCAEIYNEIVYDLLEPLSRRAPRRTALELRADRTGSVYVKGLRCLPVSSADEAFRLALLGKHNQHLAATKLNQQSSRSHALFSIRLVRCADRPSPRFSQVSSLTFCDLAGSERQRHAGTAGERTREAGSINSSLLTLRRCVETLQRNQRNPRASMLVPFRDSKLTRLLQPYFSGSGQAAMIVNISQCPSLFDETFNALKFSSLARSVIVSEPTPKRLRLAAAATASPGYGVASKSAASGRAGGGVRTGRRQDGEQRLADEDDELEALDVTYADEEEAEMADLAQMDKEELLAVIASLRQSRRQLDEAVEARELQIRRELIAERDRLMETMEERFEAQLQQQKDKQLDQHEERLTEYLSTANKLASRQLELCRRRGEARVARLNERLGEATARLDQQDAVIAALTAERDEARLQLAALEARLADAQLADDALSAEKLLKLRRVGDFQQGLRAARESGDVAACGGGEVEAPAEAAASGCQGNSE
ncbi:hypothetical protein BOX15_Mlig027361g2 [Macrostomum lignano]|uniref:Kinesin-like protein n=2 Tax=Macrostomum lignano TaxID=282301 RepID=A0A267H793_9PLAT|nr:hypothetical protein BOX15_Mlig027361g2 [Macrostomum lignano]